MIFDKPRLLTSSLSFHGEFAHEVNSYLTFTDCNAEGTYNLYYRRSYHNYVQCPGGASGTGECIRDTELCDGTQSCLDWADETDNCPSRSES